MILYSRAYEAGTRVADTVSVQLELYVLSSDILCAYGIAVYTVGYELLSHGAVHMCSYSRQLNIIVIIGFDIPTRVSHDLPCSHHLALLRLVTNPNVTANRYTVISI